ncbi:MAG: hypothetical protein BRD27_04955 [Bacteroidetes bacterium QH_10_64_19]|nr:MAG: hypothetical protein BRD27_04955 [Bacteroidetes bacterium QH_10_64_19]
MFALSMPTAVVGLLVILVGLYVVLAGAAWGGFLQSRRQPAPSPPLDWPSVSVVVPVSTESPEATMQALQACDYPPDRLDVLLLPSGSVESSFGNEHGDLSVRRVSVEARDLDERALETALDAARGDVVLTLPPGSTVSPPWIRVMVRPCTADTPMVVGPTVIEHEDLFLPRLQALQHVGRQALSGGLSQFGLPLGPGTQNRALRPASLPSEQDGRAGFLRTAPPDASTLYAPDPDAIARQSPVSSFVEYTRTQARRLARSSRDSSWIVRGRAVGLWLLHTVLLACSVVAVARPAGRQPPLLALVGKMGADVLLTLPAAKLYGQRDLLRSIVPSELMLVLAMPIAGVWALVEQLHDS